MGVCIGKQKREYKIKISETENQTLSLGILGPSPLKPCPKMKDLYILKSLIGKGNFGIVRKAVYKNDPNHAVAIKSVRKDSKLNDYRILLREIEILQSIDHPNIIKFYEFFDEPSYLHIVTELCTGGELFDRIIETGTICEKKAASYMEKMLGAVNHLHSLGICHRDLKPQNFLFENKSEDAELKIIDFGLSNKLNGKLDATWLMKTFVGTPYYLAPEILIGAYDIKCDLWSLGVTMYVMLTGELPFTGANQAEVFQKVTSNETMNMEPLRNLSENAVDLIKKLLIKNPQIRISAKDALKHPWLEESHEGRPSLGKEVLELLREYTPPCQLYKIAMKVIVKYLSVEDLKDVRDMFFQIDTQNQGFITVEEIRDVFRTNGGSIPKKQLEKFFKNLSSDNNGRIYYSDFIEGALSTKLFLDDNKINWAFKMFETNEDGCITAETLRKSVKKLGNSKKVEKMQKNIMKVLTVKDSVSFDQFKEILRSSPKSTNLKKSC